MAINFYGHLVLLLGCYYTYMASVAWFLMTGPTWDSSAAMDYEFYALLACGMDSSDAD